MLQVIKPGAAALAPLPRSPLLFQLNTKVLLGEMSKQQNRKVTLDDFPDEHLEKIKNEGYDIVYFLGVWQTGEFGMKKSIKLLDCEPCMKGLPREAASSSPFAITDYSCHVDFGGDEALGRLRDRCHGKGLRLLVDFVPNHMAVDHPWTKERPELIMQGSENSLNREPQNFFKVGDKVFAHGKDMYYDGWEDTAQINYGNPAARTEMENILKKIAGLCDGVRCDMAMLMCEDILEKTWGGRLAPPGQPKAHGQFWPPAIKGAKGVNPGFLFVAECYWDREYDLHCQGFDFAYDKTLYDRLKELDVGKVKGHLQADRGYQMKLVRFLENHDEERAADTWKDKMQNLASAVISFTIPGMHFIHDGQQEGRYKRISMHVNCRDKIENDVRDKGVAPLYTKLIKALGDEALRNGHWRHCWTSPSQDGNPSFERFVAHCAYTDDQKLTIVVVNFCGHDSNGHVGVPKEMEWVRGRKCILTDLLSDAVVCKDGGVLLGDHGGLWLSLKPWQSHIFQVTFGGKN